jgi:hypothetical protein
VEIFARSYRWQGFKIISLDWLGLLGGFLFNLFYSYKQIALIRTNAWRVLYKLIQLKRLKNNGDANDAHYG